MMTIVKPLASILRHLSKVAGFMYLTIGLYAGSLLVLYKVFNITSLPLDEKSDGRLFFLIPFTSSPFIIGEGKGTYFPMMVVLFILYGLFFWLLANVFEVFTKERLFTEMSVTHLSRFYKLNMIGPITIILAFILVNENIRVASLVTILHLILGVFTFFMYSIFKQGLILQQEQDLTL